MTFPPKRRLWSRRSINSGLWSAIAGGLLASATPSFSNADADREDALADLNAVRRWGCQYQNIDVDAITASDLDLIVLEPSLNDDALIFLSPDEIDRMKTKPGGGRRLVLAYLAVGEANVNRWFWPNAWRRSPPDWLGPLNPSWPGARLVRYWAPEWQTLIFSHQKSLLNRIVASGFDGVLLDRIDSYVEWQEEFPGADVEMVKLVQRISQHARERNRGFLIMGQNAEDLLYDSAYRRALDGLNKESLFTGLRGMDTVNAESDVAWSLERLELARKAGITVLVTDYAKSEKMRAYARRAAKKHGMPLFQGTWDLDRLPL
ncbi:endo alpha-1,4 polygalactosaminidase [Oricola indica]|uniref:endo alpha-1,4 polygalactosaminidase n=1 Tax=Oricola indica TaxID=2872591 RepID=UPI001CBCDDA6